MAASYDEAVALVTATGTPFETTSLTIRGIDYRVFKNAPPNLRVGLEMARAFGDNTFIVYEEERWSFADVLKHADALGHALVNRYGVRKGDRVAIAMRNLPEWPISFAAITSVGAVCVSLNSWWTEDELAEALADSRPTVLLADRSRVKLTERACDRLGIRIVAVRSGEGESTDYSGSAIDLWEDILELGQPMPEVEIDPDDDATILYTSGTTGVPKGSVSTHRAIIQALLAFRCVLEVQRVRQPDYRGYGEDPCILLAVPLFHVTGCVLVMLSSFAGGMRLAMMRRWDPEGALELIEREKVTAFIGVPTQSWDLVESPSFSQHDTSSLLIIAGGGAPFPPALVRRVAAEFVSGRPSLGYGLTETNAYGPTNLGEDCLSHPTSVGRVLPILEVEIRDTEGGAVPPGEQGEIYLKGPNLVRGYWDKPEETAYSLVNGWLRTGDIGHLDADGFVYVDDRIKDIVLRGGENISAAELEAVIYEMPEVREVAVFGIPDPRLGEEVAAVINLKKGCTLTADELKAHVAHHLAAFKVPSVVVFSDQQLPRGSTGKISKSDLRNAYLEMSGQG